MQEIPGIQLTIIAELCNVPAGDIRQKVYTIVMLLQPIPYSPLGFLSCPYRLKMTRYVAHD